MRTLSFTVDAALLRELGERLVGKAHIALAELVKNSYDADATQVVIRFGGDVISVTDNGNGMTYQQFKDFWMRIGSPHKEARTLSDRLDRPLTGSKGVGRLAVQLLASNLKVRTVPFPGDGQELFAEVNWDAAVAAQDLTSATAQWTQRSATGLFAANSSYGTELVMSELHQVWSAAAFEDLAREIWDLQPPFASSDSGRDERTAFNVTLESEDETTTRRFAEQMGAVLRLWTARLRGRLKPDGAAGVRDRTVELAFEFVGSKPEILQYDIPNCHIEDVDFEIRVFNLQNRQPLGIKVGDAREYLNRFGGVHVYDVGFRLPYYGVDTDWLRIEMDHSHRLSRSKLLPESMQVPDGLSYLPTNSRVFGVVNVNTALERRSALESGNARMALGIQVTRDRLVDGPAYHDLVRIVRWSLDYYATREAQRMFDRPAKPGPEPVRQKAERIEDVLSAHEDEIPSDVIEVLRREIGDVVAATESEAEAFTRQAGLLGALATAGMSALAYEHEAAKQLIELEDVVAALPAASAKETRKRLAEQLEGWLKRARATRALFAHLRVEGDQQEPEALLARPVLDQVRGQLKPLLLGLPISISEVDPAFRLPPAGLPEWSAVFQNLFVNASNAMLDTPEPGIRVRSEVRGRRRALYVDDVGVGVDLESAEELFKPFVRRVHLSRERRALGLGGTGLGLTIVRMIAAQVGCTVAFVEPPTSFNASVRIAWGQ